VARPEELTAASRARIAQTPAVVAVDTVRTPAARIPKVDEVECVGCNLCWLVCPVEGCITMDRVERGMGAESWEERVRLGRV
jgi:dihydropyrimidine dehydrogenase (NAD+) subunit PreA